MGTFPRGPHWVDMKALCQSLFETHADRAARQRVTMDLRLDPGPATVIGYRDVLRRAIERLVERALDAMPRGGALSLHVMRDPYVIVECSDTGSADVPSNVRTSRAELRAHGGCLWRRRERDGGTCFIAELPAAGPRHSVAA